MRRVKLSRVELRQDKSNPVESSQIELRQDKLSQVEPSGVKTSRVESS